MENTSQPLKPRAALGRGLQSLIPSEVDWQAETKNKPGLMLLPTAEISPNPNQPRRKFEEEALAGLAESMKAHGVIQPLLVRRISKERFEIVAGERRWRAAQMAGLERVPCVISDAADKAVLTLALIENIQREDLNAIEEAEAYRRLIQDLTYTQEEVAKSVGKERSTIANALRLLSLPPDVQQLVIDERITMGHARALLSVQRTELLQALIDQIITDQLSVRATETLVKAATDAPKKRRQNETAIDRDIRRQLESRFGTRVDFKHRNGRGAISIHFSTVEQLNDLLRHFEIAL